MILYLYFTASMIWFNESEHFDKGKCQLSSVECAKTETFITTAYNTVEEQTDGNPCVAASGDNICGRNDIVACPKRFKLHTRFEIDGKVYECLDRTASKYGDRIDISFDKDIQGAIRYGKQIKDVKFYE